MPLLKLLVIGALFALASDQFRLRVSPTLSAPAHWVTTTGAADWDDCESVTPLDGASGCSMAEANAEADAGDVVYIRQGVYNDSLEPARSGTLEDRITFQGYGAEIWSITNADNLKGGLHLNGVDYIVIRNCHVYTTYMLLYILNGSSYNEISDCTLNDGTATANNGINIFTLGVVEATANTHNWLHDLLMFDGGVVGQVAEATGIGCDDDGGLITIGGDNTLDGLSDYNTIEDSVIYAGSHHALKLNTRHNVVRNNFIHNEGYFNASASCQTSVPPDCTTSGTCHVGTCAPGGEYGPANLYGNRALMVQNFHTDVPAWQGRTYNLVEGNRIGNSGLPSDGNGGDNLTLGGEYDIARYNTMFFATELGMYFRSTDTGDSNYTYNNTIAANGKGPQCRIDTFNGYWPGGIRIPAGANFNIVKNTLLWANASADNKEFRDAGTGSVTANNWLNVNGDPDFVDPDYSDPTSATVPDLSLQSISGAIDAGGSLTTTVGAGVASAALTLLAPRYFQYGERGSALSNIQADWIAVGDVTNIAQIVSINYDTGAVVLDRALTWANGAQVWLKRDSSGNDQLKGSAPDIGAYERTPTP